MIKIYIAGGMFSEADVAARKNEELFLEMALNREIKEGKVEIFNPITAPFNDKSTIPSAEDIYLGDKEEILSSTHVLACLDGEDAGVMSELGMLVGKDIKVFSYASDIRLDGNGNYDGLRVPYGMNQFVIGMLLYEGAYVGRSSLGACSALIKDIRKELE